MRPVSDWLTARPVAHRGLHEAAAGVIENTRSAFQAAIDANLSIECDVQVSADGEAMVHHDKTLGRLDEGQGRLDALPAADLMRVPFRGTADRMMTLGALCDLVAGRVTLVVEVKSRFDGDLRLARRVTEVLRRYQGPVAAMSFDPEPMAALRQLAPGLRRGLAGERRRADTSPAHAPSAARFLQHAIQARPQFLAWRVSDVDTTVPQAARRLLGLPILTWTVRTPDERARAARFADQMIFEGFPPWRALTGRPSIVMRWTIGHATIASDPAFSVRGSEENAMRIPTILTIGLTVLFAAVSPAVSKTGSAAATGVSQASPIDEASSQQRRTRRAKRPVIRRPAQQQIACTRFGCGPIPRQCRIVGGRTFDGSPTGFDEVICPY